MRSMWRKQSTISSRLVTRLLADDRLMLHAPLAVRRTHAGRWQLAEGAWSWSVVADPAVLIGSAAPMAECVSAAQWDLEYMHGGLEIFPSQLSAPQQPGGY